VPVHDVASDADAHAVLQCALLIAGLLGVSAAVSVAAPGVYRALFGSMIWVPHETALNYCFVHLRPESAAAGAIRAGHRAVLRRSVPGASSAQACQGQKDDQVLFSGVVCADPIFAMGAAKRLETLQDQSSRFTTFGATSLRGSRPGARRHVAPPGGVKMGVGTSVGLAAFSDRAGRGVSTVRTWCADGPAIWPIRQADQQRKVRCALRGVSARLGGASLMRL